MKSYAIADVETEPGEEFFMRVGELVRHAVDYIQLRAKRMQDSDVLTIARRCRSLIGNGQTRFLVNGRADIALACQAHGVHLPSDGIPAQAIRSLAPDLILGRSCHTLDDCRSAAREGLDYVLLGPVFDSRSKDQPASVSLESLRQASSFGARVFALGGISYERLPLLSGSGIEGVAAITMFMKDTRVEAAVEAVRAL